MKWYGGKEYRVTILLLWFVMVLGIEGAVAGGMMSPGKHKAELKYALLLPNYCGREYFNRKGAKYSMPPREVCGVGTNHFCAGLIELYKARDEKRKKYKIIHYKQAKRHANYTKRWISKYPRCPLRKDVENVLMEANTMLGMWGVK